MANDEVTACSDSRQPMLLRQKCKNTNYDIAVPSSEPQITAVYLGDVKRVMFSYPTDPFLGEKRSCKGHESFKHQTSVVVMEAFKPTRGVFL